MNHGQSIPDAVAVLPGTSAASPLPCRYAVESPLHRRLYLALAVALVLGFFGVCATYWVPAIGGVDQNGYLVGGKMLANHGSMALKTVNPATGKPDPYIFVGRMWIGIDLGTPKERYYPKYPMGLPLLVAVALKIGGPGSGPWLAYWISPLCMTLAVLGTFFLLRPWVGSFLALLGTLVVATSPVTLGLANNPNSHAATLVCVVWGMVALLAWWQRGSIFRALPAGLLLGYAATIRYTEGLLVLPLLLVIIFGLTQRPRRSSLQAMALLAAWAIPIGALVINNLRSFGALTGYGPTNESTGFAWAYFVDNWAAMLHQLGDMGMFLFFPLAVAGLLAMYWHHAKLAWVLSAWILPNLLVYSFYYASPERPGISFLRFLLTSFPALALCACALLDWVGRGPAPPQVVWRWRDAATPVSAGVLVALALLVDLNAATDLLAQELPGRLNLDGASALLDKDIPAGSVVWSTDQQILDHLQFIGDYQLYLTDVFDGRALLRIKDVDPNQPQGLQPQRAKLLYDLLQNTDPNKLILQQQEIVRTALDAGRRVFVIAPDRNAAVVRRVLPLGTFTTRVVERWNDPLPPPSPDLARRRPFRRQPLPAPPRVDARSLSWQLIEITGKQAPLPRSPAR